MSKEDKLEPSKASLAPKPYDEDILLPIKIRLRLDEAAEIEAELLRARATREPTERELRSLATSIYEARRLRDRMLASEDFGEPAWDMLLALYCLPKRGQFIGVTGLAHHANVSEATGSRWQKVLFAERLIYKTPRRVDARWQMISLTRKGTQLIEQYLTKLFYCQSPRHPNDGDTD